MGFGTKLKDILKEKGMTIKELSEKSGISINTLYSITKRDTRLPSDDIIFRISQTLKIDISELMTLQDMENRIKEHTSELNTAISNLDTIATRIDIDGFSPEELEEIKKFSEFLKSMRETKNK